MPMCRKCGGWTFIEDRVHKCPPLWDVWVEERGDERGDLSPVHGSDAQDAVERWAKQDDAGGDYDIIAGGSLDRVHVAPVGSDEVAVWAVYAELVLTYTATEAE